MQKLLVGKYDDAFCLVQMIGEDECKVISTSSWLKQLKQEQLFDLVSINHLEVSKICLIRQHNKQAVVYITHDGKQIILSNDQKYILQDFYRDVIMLHFRLNERVKFEKVFGKIGNTEFE